MLAVAYMGLFCFVIFLESVRKKDNIFDFLSLFNLIFSLLYIIPAVSASLHPISISNQITGNQIVNNIQIPLAIFIGYFLVVIGFYSKIAQTTGTNIAIKVHHEKNIIIFIIVLLIITCLSVFLYSMQYGGLLNTLSNANLIRAGAVERGGLSFFKRFLYFGFFAAYLLASMVFIKNNNKEKKLLLVLFLFSVFISLIASFMVAARSPIIWAFLIFYLASILYTGKLNIKIMAVFVFCASLFVLYGKNLFYSLSAIPNGFDAMVERFIESIQLGANNEDQSSIEMLLSNFSFPVYSLYVATNTPYELRLLGDWFYGLLSLIPDQLMMSTEEVPSTISYYNTMYLVQTDEYSIPPGFLAFCLYSMSWSGLIIFCFIYGWLGRFWQNILSNHLHQISWMPFIYVLSAQIWVEMFACGDPKILFQTYFWAITSTFILFCIATKISVRKNYSYANIQKKSFID